MDRYLADQRVVQYGTKDGEQSTLENIAKYKSDTSPICIISHQQPEIRAIPLYTSVKLTQVMYRAKLTRPHLGPTVSPPDTLTNVDTRSSSLPSLHTGS